MADIIKTIPDLLLDFADNNTGDITPQYMRNLIVSFEALAPTIPIVSTGSSKGLGAGNFYLSGYYEWPAADANLTQASTTQVLGTASSSYAAHAGIVAAAVGTTDGSNLVLTVTGTSITDAGVRTTGDSEIVVADCLSASTDDYYETIKKWLGPVTFTLSSAAATAFAFDFNYGFSAYDDVSNTDFTIDSFAMEWLGAAGDTGFNVDIHHHKSTGWTYHATAFEAGPPPVYMLSTDHSTDRALVNGDYGRWKRTGLSDAVAGADAEGIIVHVTTTVNNSLEWINSTVKVKPTP